jgi:hypothetical protein
MLLGTISGHNLDLLLSSLGGCQDRVIANSGRDSNPDDISLGRKHGSSGKGPFSSISLCKITLPFRILAGLSLSVGLLEQGGLAFEVRLAEAVRVVGAIGLGLQWVQFQSIWVQHGVHRFIGDIRGQQGRGFLGVVTGVGSSPLINSRDKGGIIRGGNIIGSRGTSFGSGSSSSSRELNGDVREIKGVWGIKEDMGPT